MIEFEKIEAGETEKILINPDHIIQIISIDQARSMLFTTTAAWIINDPYSKLRDKLYSAGYVRYLGQWKCHFCGKEDCNTDFPHDKEPNG